MEAATTTRPAFPPGPALPRTLQTPMQALTLDVIIRAVVGVKDGARQDELKSRLRALIDPVGSRASVMMMLLSRGHFGIAGNVREFEQRRAAVDELIYEEIARR